MTTRNPSRRFSPSLPSGTHIGIALASAAAGLIIGVTAGNESFQPWDRDSSISASGSGVALAPSYAPAALSGSEALKAEMALHEALTEAQFGPLNTTTNIAPGSGLTPDAIQPSAREGNLVGRALPDVDPAISYPLTNGQAR